MKRYLAVLAGLMGLGFLVCAGGSFVLRQQAVDLFEVGQLVMDDPEWAEIADSDAVIRYLAAHPDAISFAVCTVIKTDCNDTDACARTAPDCSLTHADTQPRPLASAVKVAVLSAYSDAVSEGRISPHDTVTVHEWQQYYLPGTDGGAHPAALETLHIEDEATLEQVVEAMITFSDNAATDLIMERVGLTEIDQTLARLDIQMDPLHLLGGEFLLFAQADDVDRSQLRSLAENALNEWRAAGQPAVRVGSIADQIHGTDLLDHRASASEYAQLLSASFGPDFDKAAADRIHHAMEWPMRKHGPPSGVTRMGTKGGALPGVLTEAMYVIPESGPYAGQTRVVILLMEDMPMAGWFAMMGSFAQQKLMVQLATDPAVEAQLSKAMATPAH